MPELGYAVIDLETTGLFPGGHDRIIEIGVVIVDPDGSARDEWTTLVNPERDLGPSRLHGIHGRHAKHAPVFADISDELADVINGRTLVAHNASFDTRFLAAEWHRVGALKEQELPFGHICTMQVAKKLLPGSGRTLQDCCAAFDIEIEGAHSALGDARATAALLAAFRAAEPSAELWRDPSTRPVDAALIGRRGISVSVVPRESAFALAQSMAPSERATPMVPNTSHGAAPSSGESTVAGSPLLGRIVSAVPADEVASEDDDAYLALLDRCLEDNLLTVTEAESLATFASHSGISDERRRHLHERYFESVVETAWADNVLTDEEVAEIQQLAAVLEISDRQRAEAMVPRSSGRRARQSAAEPHVAATAANGPAHVDLHLAEGDHIVLTGSMRRKREEWSVEIQTRGFVVHPAVTKKTRVLVASDPDSLSGKARKARQYGVPIVSEDWLESLLRVG